MLTKLLCLFTLLFAFHYTSGSKCLIIYSTNDGDTCESVAKAHSIKVDELEKTNPKLKCKWDLTPDTILCINGKRSLDVSIEISEPPTNRTALHTLIDAVNISAEAQGEDGSDDQPLPDITALGDV